MQKFIFILGSFYSRKKKTFILKPRKTCNKTLSSQELVARTAAGGLFAVGTVLFSFVVCKVRDGTQTHQMKLPASLRRLKNLLTTTFVLFHKTLKLLTISSHLDLLTLGQYYNMEYLQSFPFINSRRANTNYEIRNINSIYVNVAFSCHKG